MWGRGSGDGSWCNIGDEYFPRNRQSVGLNKDLILSVIRTTHHELSREKRTQRGDAAG